MTNEFDMLEQDDINEVIAGAIIRQEMGAISELEYIGCTEQDMVDADYHFDIA